MKLGSVVIENCTSFEILLRIRITIEILLGLHIQIYEFISLPNPYYRQVYFFMNYGIRLRSLQFIKKIVKKSLENNKILSFF